MATIIEQINENAETANEISELADMLTEQFDGIALLVSDADDFAHAQLLLKGLRHWSTVLNRDLAKLANTAAAA